MLKDPSKLVHSQPSKDLSFSYFYEGLEYWYENNLSNDYETFYTKMIQNVGPNLATVLHYKDLIANTLFDAMRQERSFAFIPFTNLVCLLAKDVREEFYTSFGLEAFSLLAKLLKQINDPSIIESIFMCITYLFKYLSVEIVQDFEFLFRILSSLLFLPQEKKAYNRRFLSEALGFLFKRTKYENLLSIFNVMITVGVDFEKYEENPKTFANILFYSIKSVKGNLNSQHERILSFFCYQFQLFNGKIEILLHLMESLLLHFDGYNEKLKSIFKLHFYPSIFQLSNEVNEST